MSFKLTKALAVIFACICITGCTPEKSDISTMSEKDTTPTITSKATTPVNSTTKPTVKPTTAPTATAAPTFTPLPTVAPTATPTVKPTPTIKPTEKPVKVGRTAYDTPTGKKYHFDKSCAGKNAFEVSLDEISKTKDPCKKCAY